MGGSVMRKWFLRFLVAMMLGAGATEAGETQPVSVKLRASEASGAAIIEEVQLYSNSHALVIGIDDYGNGWPRLGKAVSDARSVAAALMSQGFSVTLKTDLRSAEMEKTFEDFFLLKGSDPDARLFVWFAGHGHTDVRGEGYLIPVDGVLESDRVKFRRTALSLRRFGEYVRLADAKHVFTVFDSCFAGTIFNVARSAPPPQITRVTTQPVRQFLTSGDAGQQVSDDGTFARLFIEALAGERRADRNGDGYITASEMGSFLDEKVSNFSGNRQTPRYGKLSSPAFDKGDFVFQLASTEPVPRVNRGLGIKDKETVFWQSIQDSKDPSMFEAYLDQYPDGSFAPLAKAKIAVLGAKQVAVAHPPKAEIQQTDRKPNLRAHPELLNGKWCGNDGWIRYSNATTSTIISDQKDLPNWRQKLVFSSHNKLSISGRFQGMSFKYFYEMEDKDTLLHYRTIVSGDIVELDGRLVRCE